MKILVHTNQILYPADTGGKIRSSKLLEQLAKWHQLTIVCFQNPADREEDIARMGSICQRLELIQRDQAAKSGARFFWDLALNLASPHPYNVWKYYDRRMEALLGRLWREGGYDLLLCDPISPGLNLINLPARPRIVFEHNVESQLFKRRWQSEKNPLARFYLGLQWKKLLRYEGSVARSFDHCIMVSEPDCQTMERLFGVKNTSAIPMGVDVDYFRPEIEAESTGHMVFTGSMDWPPNVDAMKFFVGQVLPIIREKRAVKLWIVGRRPLAEVERLALENPDVEVTGTVDDVRPYIARAQLYLVPLRVGGGTRLKIFEAMAMQKAVVSTTLGAEGLPVTHGSDIVLADGARDFAAAVLQLLEQEEKRRALAGAAREMVARRHGWEAAGRVFSDICQRVVDERKEP